MSTGSAQQTSTTTAGVSPFAQNYVNSMLGAAQQQVFNTDQSGQITGINPYQAYGSQVAGSPYLAGMGPGEQQAAQLSVAGPSGLQQQAYQGAANMQVPGALYGAQQAAQQGIQGMLGASGYMPSYFGNQYQAPPSYTPIQAQTQQVGAPNLQQYQMVPAQQVGTQEYTGQNVGQYMSPYMQNVVDVQQQEAKRQAAIADQTRQAQAARSGMFGGVGSAISRAQANADLQRNLQNIQATGSQAAFQNAQQQFNAQQQANLQAQQANQQAGLTTGQQNLAANLGVQQLGAGQNLQAQLANQQAQQAANQLAAQQQQFGYGQGMTAAQLAAQYGLAGQQAAEQSRQFGANLGLQGYQGALQGANTLGGLGTQQLAAQQGIAGLQNQLGQQQQANQQQIINQAMQNFQLQKMYPQQQLQYLSSMLSGLPVSSTGQVTNIPAPSLLSQIAGLGTAGLGGLGLASSVSKKSIPELLGLAAKGGLTKDFEKKKVSSGIDTLALHKALAGEQR